MKHSPSLNNSHSNNKKLSHENSSRKEVEADEYDDN
jgi:hypothetical protein